MGVRLRKHSGGHKWVIQGVDGVCRYCFVITGRLLPKVTKWECSVVGCKATRKTKHKHVV